MEMLNHAHSGLRWIILLLLVITFFKSLMGWMGNQTYTGGDRKLALFTVIAVHTQLLIGLVQYFAGKFYQGIETTDATLHAVNRFYRMEHISGMIIAIALITIGSSRAKKASSDKLKHKRIAIMFGLGLLIILACIPWPFMAKFANLGWF